MEDRYQRRGRVGVNYNELRPGRYPPESLRSRSAKYLPILPLPMILHRRPLADRGSPGRTNGNAVINPRIRVCSTVVLRSCLQPRATALCSLRSVSVNGGMLAASVIDNEHQNSMHLLVAPLLARRLRAARSSTRGRRAPRRRSCEAARIRATVARLARRPDTANDVPAG